MKVIKPNIFEYDNYRLFLKDLYNFYKATVDAFSYRYFSKRAGFSSPNYLKLVIEGERNLSEKSTHAFIKAFKLSKYQGDFFGLLVRFNQSKEYEERADLALKILKSRNTSKTQMLDGEHLSYYSSWVNIALRELICLPDFKNDLQWIVDKFRGDVDKSMIQESLKTLLALGLIDKTEDESYKQKETNVKTQSRVNSALIVKYHKDMIASASDSIESVHSDLREISSVSLPLSKKMMDQMRVKVQKFKEELMHMSLEDNHPEEVYQINFQIFPLTGTDK